MPPAGVGEPEMGVFMSTSALGSSAVGTVLCTKFMVLARTS